MFGSNEVIKYMLQRILTFMFPKKKMEIFYPTKLGGLDLSRLCLDRDAQSRHWQKVSLDSQENLDTFQKLILTIEISRWIGLGCRDHQPY
jgi:hypothetical protein